MTPLIIDVREKFEYKMGHVKGAINIPLGQISAGSPKLEDTPKDTPIVVYCRSGGRSGMAAQALMNQGFSNVQNGINQRTVESNLA